MVYRKALERLRRGLQRDLRGEPCCKAGACFPKQPHSRQPVKSRDPLSQLLILQINLMKH